MGTAQIIATVLAAAVTIVAVALAVRAVMRMTEVIRLGRPDPARFTDNAKFYFDRTALGDYASSLGKLGAIRSIKQTGVFDRGGMTYRGFAVEFANGTKVNLSTFTVPDGRYEQFLVEPAE